MTVPAEQWKFTSFTGTDSTRFTSGPGGEPATYGVFLRITRFGCLQLAFRFMSSYGRFYPERGVGILLGLAIHTSTHGSYRAIPNHARGGSTAKPEPMPKSWTRKSAMLRDCCSLPRSERAAPM